MHAYTESRNGTKFGPPLGPSANVSEIKLIVQVTLCRYHPLKLTKMTMFIVTNVAICMAMLGNFPTPKLNLYKRHQIWPTNAQAPLVDVAEIEL